MSKLSIAILGAGGREHALTWKLAQSDQAGPLTATPGNPGMARWAQCLPDAPDADITVVGPEAPLVAGVVDRYRANGRVIFGPTAAAARLEGSKTFSKTFMQRTGIPTARFVTVSSPQAALDALAHFSLPVVLKADGLAAGKGVVIASTREDALDAIKSLDAPALVIEDFLPGEEVSFIVISDGHRVLPLPPSQDHKRAYDGDQGPNTGGMGAYCDERILTPAQTGEIMDRVIQPAIHGMAKEGHPFTGFLYAGLMMTSNGPYVLEFNVRLGDPEAQAILHRLQSDLLPVVYAAARGDLSGITLTSQPEPSVCVVLAADGYPGTVRSGDIISGIDQAEESGAVVFQAGTRQTEQGLVTSGGRVLGVTASGPTLPQAIAHTYAAVDRVHFPGRQFRRDIGWKGSARW